LNGDVIFYPDESLSLLEQMAEAWSNLGKAGTQLDGLLGLLLKEKAWGYEWRGDFFQVKGGRIHLRGDKKEAPFVYTGVQILHPRKLDAFELGYFTAKVFWDAMIEDHTLYGFVWQGSWFHVGDQKAYGDLPSR